MTTHTQPEAAKSLVRRFESEHGRILSGSITLLLPLVELKATITTEYGDLSATWNRDSPRWPTVPQAFKQLIKSNLSL